jgi:microcystin-dependent protein
MAQQEITADQLKDHEITDADISNSASVSESKLAFNASTGHDHDSTGTPSLSVLVSRRLKPQANSPADLRVKISAGSCAVFPSGRVPDTIEQQFNFAAIMPVGATSRIDLLHIDSAGYMQRRAGTATTGTPVAPAYDGVLPIAEVGPLTSATTQITAALIKDVRPFLASNSTVKYTHGATTEYIHGVTLGTNLTTTVTDGVATLNATVPSAGWTAVDASTTVKGIVKTSVNPGVGVDPIAVEVNDPQWLSLGTAIQKSGSVAYTGNQSLGGFSLTDVNTLTFASHGVITSAADRNVALTTTGLGKTRIISASGMQVPIITGTPTSPAIGDIWFDSSVNNLYTRQNDGVKVIAISQTGVLSANLYEVVGDPTYPPTSGDVGTRPCLNFPKDLSNNHSIYCAFQVPTDALLTEDMHIRISYCMSTSEARNVYLGYEYTTTQVDGALLPQVPTATGNLQLTPSPTLGVLEVNATLSIYNGHLYANSLILIKLTRVSKSVLDSHLGDWQLLNIGLTYSKRDISSLRNVIEVFDEVTDLGQIHTLKFRGNPISVSASAGTATVDVTDAFVELASDQVIGIVQLSKVPADPTHPTAVGANEPWIPLINEKQAMAGSVGTPGVSNLYVTQSDTHLLTTNQLAALAGTHGTPALGNEFVTTTDTRLPSTAENAALVGSGTTGPGSGNPYVLADHPNIPSTGQKAALAGTYGTPGGSNKYVTQTDATYVLNDGTRSFTAVIAGITPTSASHVATKGYVDSQVAAVVTGHNTLTGLQGGASSEYYHFTAAAYTALTGGSTTTLHSHSHSTLTNRDADDHTQYVKVDGTRAFTGVVSGVTPTTSTHLATKGYVDTPHAPQTHAASHLPDSILDPLTVVAPVDIGTGNAVGSVSAFSRSDHVHKHPVFASGDMHTEYSKADGTRAFSGVVSGVTPTLDAHLATKAYADTPRTPASHAASHITTDAIATAIASPPTNGLMSSTDKIKLDGITAANIPTTDEKAALAGTGTPSGSNKYVTADNAALTNARAPTTHASTHLPDSVTDALTVAAPVDIGTGNSIGTANSLSRSNHVHKHPAIGSGDLHSEYIKSDGTRGFSGTVSGSTPTLAAHLATKSYVDSSVGAGAASPTGAVTAYAGTTEPAGWLFCWGQQVSTATYAALYAVLGTTYGSGAGTFGIPDMRGRVAPGRDNMGGAAANRITVAGSGITGTTLGASGGTETHTLSEAQMPAHTHSTSIGTGFASHAFATFAGGAQTIVTYLAYASTSVGSSTAHQNTQPSVILNYIIKT